MERDMVRLNKFRNTGLIPAIWGTSARGL